MDMEKMEWRTPEQDPQAWKLLDPLGTVLTVAGIAALGATIPDRSRIIGVACCAVLAAVSLAVYLRFPQYYTLMDKKEYTKSGFKARVKHLDLAVFGPCFGLGIQLRHFCITGWVWLVALSLLVAAAVFGLLWVCSREVREHGHVQAVAVLIALFLGVGVVINGNHYLNRNPEPPQTYTVMETTKSGSSRSGRSYACVVELEPGVQKKIPVTFNQYGTLQPGDTVRVFYGPGAFGVEYAYFVE